MNIIISLRDGIDLGSFDLLIELCALGNNPSHCTELNPCDLKKKLGKLMAKPSSPALYDG